MHDPAMFLSLPPEVKFVKKNWPSLPVATTCFVRMWDCGAVPISKQP